MRFLRYGIEFERLGAERLEMVRRWRNQEAVRLRMRYREVITARAQSDWFNSLHAQNDWYFVAVRRELPFGLFHIKEVNWETRCGEAGGFVCSPVWIGAIEPGMAVLGLMDFAFFVLGLDFLEAVYHREYKDISLLNQRLGYEVVKDEADGFVRARVNFARYLESTAKLRKAASLLGGKETCLTDPDGWLAERAKEVNKDRSLGI
jgi:hypothetical protein